MPQPYVKLKKILRKKRETSLIIRQMIEYAGENIIITDEDGQYIFEDNQPLENDTFFPIYLEEEIIGKVYGDLKKIKPIINLIQFLVNKEHERKKLGAETLGLYREVNLMYNFAQKLAEKINPAEIAQLTLEETKNLISVNKGVVTLFSKKQNNEIVASFGISPPLSLQTLTQQYDFFQKLTNKKTADILNNYPTNNTLISILYSPLKVKNHILGAITLISESNYQFTAADLKVLSTLSVQSASAIESALLYEKNISEVRKRETAIKLLHEVTSRFVPSEFIKHLGYDKITQVALGDSTEKEVTVLFSDIRGYTTLSEGMTPAETFQFVNAFNGRMGPVILKNHGFINQYLGDGIMAIFPSNPSDALKAAIEMQKELQLYNEERHNKNRPPIKIGIGLHTGKLIMGITGDEQRLDATTISDTVNTAARIESLTKYYGVNILLSESSVEKIQSDLSKDLNTIFQLRYLGKVQVKGKNQAIKIYDCFDGDLPQMINLKKQSSKCFESAMQHFYNKNFSDAAFFFNQSLTKNPNDKTASLFLEKSNYLKTKGVDVTWQGVETMAVK